MAYPWEHNVDLSGLTTRSEARLRRPNSRLPMSFKSTANASFGTMTTCSADIPTPLNLAPERGVDGGPTSGTSLNQSSSSGLHRARLTRTREAGGPSSSAVMQKSSQGRRPQAGRLRTPSLLSDSSISAPDSAWSMPRTIASTTGKNFANLKVHSGSTDGSRRTTSPARKALDDDPFPGAVLGISLPPTISMAREQHLGVYKASEHEDAAIPSHEEGLSGHILPYTSAFHDLSAASSSRCSESPFSILSTPTSASSYSPNVVTESGFGQHTGNSPRGDQSVQASRTNALRVRTNNHAGSNATHMSPSGVTGEKERLLTTSKVDQYAPKDARNDRVPPELAHLNVDPSISASPGRMPPQRPSRDDTIVLADDRKDHAVVHSDLPPIYTTFLKRTASTERPPSAKSSSGSARRLWGFSSRSSSRQGSLRVDNILSSPASTHLSNDQADRSGGSVDIRRQDSPMTGIELSPVRPSKFGFFTRHPREITSTSEKPERGRRRGPAAGTGHEGYAKLSFRGRSGGMFGGGAFGRSPSADSTTGSWKSTFLSRKNKTGIDSEDESNISPKTKSSTASLRPQASIPKLYKSTPAQTLDANPRSKDNSQPPRTVMDPRDQPSVHSSATRLDLKEVGTLSTDVHTTSLSKQSHKKTRMAETVDGKEGHWLRPIKSKPRLAAKESTNLASRLRECEERSALGRESEKVFMQSSQHDAAHYAMNSLGLSVSPNDIHEVIDSERSGQRVDTDTKTPSSSIVPYQMRHEGLLPSPYLNNDPQMASSPSIGFDPSTDSPELLKAQTATSAKGPQLVDIPMTPTGVRSSVSLPRLSSVGRIPHVVSKKDRDRKLPDRSFSRPFTGQQARPTIPPVDPLRITTDPPKVVLPVSSATSEHEFQLRVKRDLFQEEFITFPPRKNSELSYTSSSGKDSPTAIDSKPALPEDSWSEYNDLCEEIMPLTNPRLGRPLVSLSRVPPQHALRSHHNSSTDRLREKAMFNAIPFRNSRSTQSTSVPGTPFSISDYLAEGDGGSKSSETMKVGAIDASGNATARLTPSSPNVKDLSTSVGVAKKIVKAPQDQPAKALETKVASTVKRAPVTGAFRHEALLTSKWLSFGKILFSPAHKEAEDGVDGRVLILDGIGTEWAFYCALRYPGCQFYHLGPEPSNGKIEVPNYKHIPHPSLSSAFPFPGGFFSCVILRFPRVTSDAGYQTCMSEIKRTLRPGGYLEMLTLDLDLMSMGSKARKAVKDLKIRLHQADSSKFSLWNQSDAFLKLMGRRGFESIQRCVVALPAAGRIHRSHDAGVSKAEDRRDTPSLSDLLQNKNEDGQRDEQITRTVAKVGRWWYSTCYEDPIRSLTDEKEFASLWETPGLLHEMERQGTGLKLLICSAQKPTCAKRRTASV